MDRRIAYRKKFRSAAAPPPKKSAPAHLRGGRGSLGRGYFVDALIECPGRGMGGELSETISQDSRSAREFHGPGTPSGPRLSSPRKSHREAPVLRPRSPPKKAPRLARSKPGFPGKGILSLCTGEWFLAGLCVEVFRGKEEKISDHQFGSGGPRRRIRAESPEALSALAFRTGFPHWRPHKKSAPAHLFGGRGSLGRGYFVDALIECPRREIGGGFLAIGEIFFGGPGGRLFPLRLSGLLLSAGERRCIWRGGRGALRDAPGGACARGNPPELSPFRLLSPPLPCLAPERLPGHASCEPLAPWGSGLGVKRSKAVRGSRGLAEAPKKVPRHTCVVAGAPWEGDILWMH